MTRAPLALKIAWRYLKAPKSHGAVNAISIISVTGVAVATAAIVIVLSVFNGFRFHLNQRLDSLTADISVSPAMGKVFEQGDSLALSLSSFPGVELAMPQVSDNALVIADAKEMPVTLKGVDPVMFAKITNVDSLLLDGRPVSAQSPRDASIAVGVAQRLGIYSATGSLFIFAPKRHGRVNMANPASSFLSDSVQISSVFRTMQNEFDENTVITHINTVRELLQYGPEASSIEIKVKPDYDPSVVAASLRTALGDAFIVKDRQQQQEINFRMVAIEKWITFLLLTFILLIASFNIISTLCMLIIDKGSSLDTLSKIGLDSRRIGTIFLWESLLVTFLGGGIGLVLGVIVSLLQEKFGILKLAGDPENLVIQAYPVRVEWIDLGVTLIPILVIGLVTAAISSSFARSKALNLSVN